MEGNSPEQIAKTLFSVDASPPLSYHILSSAGDDLYYSFEILFTILFEGFDVLVKGLDKIDSTKITKKHYEGLNPWFASLGYNLNVKRCDKENRNEYDKNYCKAVIKDKEYEKYFEIKNIKKNYNFFLNPKINDLNAR